MLTIFAIIIYVKDKKNITLSNTRGLYFLVLYLRGKKRTSNFEIRIYV